MADHAPGGNSICVYCDEAFASEALLDRHVALEHTDSQRMLYIYAAIQTSKLIEIVESELKTLKEINRGYLIKSTVGTAASSVGTIASVVGAFGGPALSLVLLPVGIAVDSAAVGLSMFATKTRDKQIKQAIDRIREAVNFYDPIARLLDKYETNLPYEDCEENPNLNSSRAATGKEARSLQKNWTTTIRGLPDEVQKDKFCMSNARATAGKVASTLQMNWTTTRRGFTKVLKSFHVPGKTAYKASVKTLGTVTRSLAAVGGIIQAVEIGFLVKKWTSEPSNTEPLKELLQQLRLIAEFIEGALVGTGEGDS